MKHEPRCTGTKICKECLEEKSVLAFATDKRLADGLVSVCRECYSVVSKDIYRRSSAMDKKIRKAGLKRTKANGEFWDD